MADSVQRDLLDFLISKRQETLPALKLLQPWANFIFENGKTIDIRTYPIRYKGWIGLLASGWDSRFDHYNGMERGRFPKGHYPFYCLIGFAFVERCKTYTTVEDFVSDRHLHLNVPEQFISPCYGWILNRRVAIKPLYYIHRKNKGKKPLLSLIGQMARCRISIAEMLEKVQLFEEESF